jgi:hypothetical protein
MSSRFFRYDSKTQSVVEVARQQQRALPQYPLPLNSLAVHPTQIAEAREFDRAAGVPTDYTEDGSPLMNDARHYYRYRRAHGVHFKNGYSS